MRTQLEQASRALGELTRLVDRERSLVQEIRGGLSKAKESQVLQRLAEVPVESMRDASDESLRLESVRRAGLTSVAAVYLASETQLERIHGISPEGAQILKAVAHQMYDAVARTVAYRLSADDLGPADLELLTDVRSLDQLQSASRGGAAKAAPVADALRKSLERTQPLRSRLRWWFTDSEKRRQAIDAVADLTLVLGDVSTSQLLRVAGEVLDRVVPEQNSAVRADFEKRAADYFAVIESVGGTALQVENRFLNKELLDRIDAEPLDTDLVKATLRRYQVFGSKFVLTQNRVILGDEMGLGKTMQAIGVLAQRATSGATHFLVVCPASVLVNWQREIESRSDLTLHRLHGEELPSRFQQWRSSGGVALTTFDTLKTVEVSDEEVASLGVDTLVVDEAHFVKNLGTGRSRTLARWVDRTPRVVFMTGTPLENRVDEFVNLASLLDKPFAESLSRAALAAGSDTFRHHVAPIYLRRNAEEVLSELPDLIEVKEFCSWDGADYHMYMQGVAEGNFMAMRRAGMLPRFAGLRSNKMERLLEIAEEAFASHQKVIVFSYFRDVLDQVAAELGSRVFGPITGDIPPKTRQDIVDRFTAATEPAALVGQIQAAGTGLNIQAASVVILCEPQVKPSLEVQAIARAHRMGQVRKVQVHRLLIPEGIDSLMTDMLERKQAEFDAYARDSDLADAASGAKDRTEESIARVVVLEERRRLQLGNAPEGPEPEN